MDKAKKIDKGEFKKPRKTGKIILTVVLSLISVVYVSPIIIVLFNSLKATPLSVLKISSEVWFRVTTRSTRLCLSACS